MHNLKRDPVRIHQILVEREDGAVYTTAPCKIQIPQRYQERHLANVGSEIYILGIFAIISDDVYGVSITNAMMRINPSSTETIDIDGTAYLEFHFDKGDKIFPNVELVKNDTITFYIYDEFIAKGRIPWFINYYDLPKLFDTARFHAGINLGNRAILDLISSTIARNAANKTELYRHVLKKPSDVETNPPVIIPFKSVTWNTSDTTSRLIGSYFGDSITSALVNPSDKVERIEELLRT